MKQQFIEKRFSAGSLDLIQKAEAVINRYLEQGFTLSLRQLYYQFVAANWLPNTEQSYKNLGNVVADARMAGLLDWEAIEDRGRSLVWSAHWRSPAEIVTAAADQFIIDKWKNQPNFVVVMVEKQALEGVLLPVCRELDVRFIANKGYSSATSLYEIGQMLARERSRLSKEVHVIYLGDHDPSGIDMTRDVRDRLQMFSEGCVEVHRIALNYDQVEEYGPPENPAKLTDSRAAGYIERFGESSWELDALEPTTLANLVREIVNNLRDEEIWDDAVSTENEMRTALQAMAITYRKNNP